jgi:hypothetical protein
MKKRGGPQPVSFGSQAAASLICFHLTNSAPAVVCHHLHRILVAI